MEKAMKQLSLLAEDNRLERLSKMGDPLEKVTAHINFEQFREKIERVTLKQDKDLKKGGRPPFDRILLWKMALLQEWYGISNDMVEYVINDRLSFQRFLGLGLDDKVPDANTLWDFKEALAKSGMDKELFEMFEKRMETRGIITRKGSIVDATFVDAPRQRNSRDENKAIKENRIPDGWDAHENAHRFSQKDTDARWTKKGNEVHYGYKDHVKVDAESKMIVSYEVTSASVHDSKTIIALLDEKDKVVNADSAYVGEDLESEIREKVDDAEVGRKVVLNFNEKGYRNRPLSDEQKAINKEKSRVRARVEHVFGYMTMSMGGLFIRSIGIVRATADITRRNLAYNMKRFILLAENAKWRNQGISMS
jgi:IS5 family transposase